MARLTTDELIGLAERGLSRLASSSDAPSQGAETTGAGASLPDGADPAAGVSTDELIERVESATSPALPSRSVLGDVGAALRGGQRDANVMALRALRQAASVGDPTRAPLANRVFEPSIAAAQQRAEDPAVGPSRQTVDSTARRLLYDAARSTPASVETMALSAATGPLAPITAGAAFGAADYDAFVPQAERYLLDQGMSPDLARLAARSAGLKHAWLEGGVESAGTALELLTAGLGKLVGLPARSAAKGTIEEIAKRTLRQRLMRGAGTAGLVQLEEGGEEFVTGGGQALLERDLGMATDDPLRRALYQGAVGALSAAPLGVAAGANVTAQQTAETRQAQLLQDLLAELSAAPPAGVAKPATAAEAAADVVARRGTAAPPAPGRSAPETAATIAAQLGATLAGNRPATFVPAAAAAGVQTPKGLKRIAVAAAGDQEGGSVFVRPDSEDQVRAALRAGNLSGILGHVQPKPEVLAAPADQQVTVEVRDERGGELWSSLVTADRLADALASARAQFPQGQVFANGQPVGEAGTTSSPVPGAPPARGFGARPPAPSAPRLGQRTAALLAGPGYGQAPPGPGAPAAAPEAMAGRPAGKAGRLEARGSGGEGRGAAGVQTSARPAPAPEPALEQPAVPESVAGNERATLYALVRQAQADNDLGRAAFARLQERYYPEAQNMQDVPEAVRQAAAAAPALLPSRAERAAALERTLGELRALPPPAPGPAAGVTLANRSQAIRSLEAELDELDGLRAAAPDRAAGTALPQRAEGAGPATEPGGASVPAAPTARSDAERTATALGKLQEEVLRRWEAEARGQAILDQLDEQGRPPSAVVSDFWAKTYLNLPDVVQRRFQRYVKSVTGFEPGSLIGRRRDGRAIRAQTWSDAYPPDVAGDRAEHLEGTERGLVSLMEAANRGAGQLRGVAPAAAPAELPVASETVQASTLGASPSAAAAQGRGVDEVRTQRGAYAYHVSGEGRATTLRVFDAAGEPLAERQPFAAGDVPMGAARDRQLRGLAEHVVAEHEVVTTPAKQPRPATVRRNQAADAFDAAAQHPSFGFDYGDVEREMANVRNKQTGQRLPVTSQLSETLRRGIEGRVLARARTAAARAVGATEEEAAQAALPTAAGANVRAKFSQQVQARAVELNRQAVEAQPAEPVRASALAVGDAFYDRATGEWKIVTDAQGGTRTLKIVGDGNEIIDNAEEVPAAGGEVVAAADVGLAAPAAAGAAVGESPRADRVATADTAAAARAESARETPSPAAPAPLAALAAGAAATGQRVKPVGSDRPHLRVPPRQRGQLVPDRPLGQTGADQLTLDLSTGEVTRHHVLGREFKAVDEARVRQRTGSVRGLPLRTVSERAAAARALRDPRREHLVIWLADADGRALEAVHAFGAVDAAAVPFAEIIERAEATGAAIVYLNHNHPSGIAKPSGADLQVTQLLAELFAEGAVMVNGKRWTTAARLDVGGHTVTDGGEFWTIDHEAEIAEAHAWPADMTREAWERVPLESLPHLDTTTAVAAYAKAIAQAGRPTALVVLADTQTKLRASWDVPVGPDTDWPALGKQIADYAARVGARNFFVAVNWDASAERFTAADWWGRQLIGAALDQATAAGQTLEALDILVVGKTATLSLRGAAPQVKADLLRETSAEFREPAAVLRETRQPEPPELGPVLREFHHDAAGAIARLQDLGSGNAIGALYHPEVGDIDLVWGEPGQTRQAGFGLAKLQRWHPEVVSDLQGILNTLTKAAEDPNTIQLDSPTHHATLRTNWKGQEKRWLLTAFEKKEPSSASRTMDVAGNPAEAGPAGRQTPPQQGGTPTVRPAGNERKPEGSGGGAVGESGPGYTALPSPRFTVQERDGKLWVWDSWQSNAYRPALGIYSGAVNAKTRARLERMAGDLNAIETEPAVPAAADLPGGEPPPRPPPGAPPARAFGEGPGDEHRVAGDELAALFSDEGHVQGGIKRGLTGRVFRDSALDTLQRAGGGLTRLVDAYHRYTDNMAAAIGDLSSDFAWLDDVPRAKRAQIRAEFEQYLLARERAARSNDAADQSWADDLLKKAGAETRRLVETVGDLFEFTSRENQRLGIQVWDAEAGQWRPIGSYGRAYWPRVVRQDIRRILDSPNRNQEAYRKLIREVADHLGITDLAAAHKFTLDQVRVLSSHDYLANLEQARSQGLPQHWYEHRFERLVPQFISSWAQRVSQIKEFGQARFDPKNPGRADGPTGAANLLADLWTEAKDRATRQYVQAFAERLYQIERQTTRQRTMAFLRAWTTATKLSNWWTSLRNLSTVAFNTMPELGPVATAEAIAATLVHWKQSKRTMERAGLLRADLIAGWVEAQDFSEVQQKVIRGALGVGGFTLTENFNRMVSGAAALNWARWALKAIERAPDSRAARIAKAKIAKFRVDPAALAAEGLDGAEGAKLMRAASNATQFTYDLRQVPLWAESPEAKFLFQFQKFGLQQLRRMDKDVFSPAFKGIEVDGKRVHDFGPLLWTLAAMVGSGAALLWLRGLLFDKKRRDATWVEIKNTAADGEQARAIELAAKRVLTDTIYAGGAGLLGDWYELTKNVADRLRGKNPLEPPAFGTLRNLWENGLVPALQQGRLTLQDLHRLFVTELPFVNYGAAAGLKVARQATDGWAAANLQEIRRDLREIGGLTERFAEEVQFEVRQAKGGQYPRSPNTPDYNALRDALQLGDVGAAKEVRDRLLGAADSPEERRRAMLGLKLTVSARRPLKIGGVDADTRREYRQTFKAWLERRRPELVGRLTELDERYLATAAAVGLGKSPAEAELLDLVADTRAALPPRLTAREQAVGRVAAARTGKSWDQVLAAYQAIDERRGLEGGEAAAATEQLIAAPLTKRDWFEAWDNADLAADLRAIRRVPALSDTEKRRRQEALIRAAKLRWSRRQAGTIGVQDLVEELSAAP